jgi:hypothetical protein
MSLLRLHRTRRARVLFAQKRLGSTDLAKLFKAPANWWYSSNYNPNIEPRKWESRTEESSTPSLLPRRTMSSSDWIASQNRRIFHMKELTTVIGSALMITAILSLVPLFSISFGALAGWIAGLFYGHTLHLLAQRLGLDMQPWQLGAMLGFVGGFFKSTTTSSSKS